jgi:hypothetical protein
VENGDGEVRLREENVAPRGRSYRQAAYLRAVLPGNDLELALAYDRVAKSFISALDHSISLPWSACDFPLVGSIAYITDMHVAPGCEVGLNSPTKCFRSSEIALMKLLVQF